MSENNNVMTTIKKNPLVIIGIVVVIVGIVLFVKMRGSEEAFSVSNIFDDTSDTSDTSDQIVENFPQSTPMNVMYSDASGNLGTTTDLGLQNLTVSGASNLNGNVLSGDVFGGGSQVKTETIVAGPAYGGRLHLLGDNVYVMAKNGVRIATDPNSSNPFGASNGNLTVDGTMSAGGTITSGGDINTGRNINMPAGHTITSPGRIHISTNSERLYLLPKDGVHITNDWGGTGNLTVTGTTSVGGALSAGSVSTSSVNIYNYGDMKTKLEELFARVKTLEDNTVKKNQEFSLQNGSNINQSWYPVGLSSDEGCTLKAFGSKKLFGRDLCPNTYPEWNSNNFKIIQ